MLAILGILRIVWPYLLGAALIGGAYYWAWNRGVEHEHKKTVAVQASFDAYVQKERQIVEALKLEWEAQIARTEEAVKAEEIKRVQTFNDLQRTARDLAGRSKSLASCRTDLAAIELYDSARAAATVAGPTRGIEKTAPTPAAGTEEYIVALHEWAAICGARVVSWEGFYRGLREARR